MMLFLQEQSGYGSTLSPSPTNIPTPSSQGSIPGLPSGPSDFTPRSATAQSLPATPSNASVRTFTDYSGEHTRLTTLHGSTGALEVNNLGGFKLGPTSITNGSSSSKLANALESSIDGIVRTNTNVATNGIGSLHEFGSSSMRTTHSSGSDPLGLGQGLIPKQNPMSSSGMNGMGMGNGVGGSTMHQFHSSMIPNHGLSVQPPAAGEGGLTESDDLSDVFTGLILKEPSMVAAPGYGRSRPRRSSAPIVNGIEPISSFGNIGIQNGYGLWGHNASENPLPEMKEGPGGSFHAPTSRSSPVQQNAGGSNLVGGVPTSRNSPTQAFTNSMGFGSSAIVPTSRNSPTHGFGHSSGSFSAGIGPHPSFSSAWTTSSHGNSGGGGGGINGGGSSSIPPISSTSTSIWSQSSFHHSTGLGGGASISTNNGGSSRPNSQSSSYSNSSISPVYSPTNMDNPPPVPGSGSGSNSGSSSGTGMGLLTTNPIGMGLPEDRDARSPFRVCYYILHVGTYCVTLVR